MNQINPKKLNGSKWTATQPVNGEKHFQVIKRLPQAPTECILEAVLTRNRYHINWSQLKDSSIWLAGWH